MAYCLYITYYEYSMQFQSKKNASLRYHRVNQKPYVDGQTMQLPNEKGQNEKQRSTKDFTEI